MPRAAENLIGKKYNHLTALYRDKDSGKWVCRCDCGNIVSVISKSLIANTTQSCGCLKAEMTSKLLSLDLVGKTFGRLTVLERCENFIGSDNTQYSQWVCQCECGTIKKIRGHDLVRGSVSSCGCLISKGEEIVRKELNKRNVSFKTQYWFDDLRSDKHYPLKFDFAIFDNDIFKCLIEYQGKQHFDDSNRGDLVNNKEKLLIK